MVFVENEVDKRSKHTKAVTRAGCAVDFSMPDERMLTSWMMGRVKAAGKTMTREAWTEFLIEVVTLWSYGYGNGKVAFLCI